MILENILNNMINTIFNENCLETMKRMPDNYIDLTVTSPPYDNLRTYNWYSWDFEWIAKELFRVTKEWWVVVWIVWDQTKNFCETMTSMKQAFFFWNLWFNLLDTMIYYKQNYAPAYPTLRRYANQFEYMYVFSKGKPKTFNPVQRDKVRNKEEKVWFRQQDWTIIRKLKGKWRETKDASNVWEYAVWGNLSWHPAVFPEKLAEDHILSWSNPLDIVYDPFMWSWTTAKMAILNARHFIWSEVSEEYCRIAQERISNHIK